MPKKSGFVSIIGLANVGKSTLLNRLIGQKIAISSRKPNTTRHNLIGILSQENLQICFVDTPGIYHNAKNFLGRQMNKAARQTFENTDLIIQLMEVGKIGTEDFKIINEINKLDIPKIFVLNKIDKIKNKDNLLLEIAKLSEHIVDSEIIPISGQTGLNCDRLINSIVKFLPEQEFIFPEDQITTAASRYIAAELIREKLFRYIHQEIPYGLGVIIDSFKEEEGRIIIHANIIVERESHKAIVIGKSGAVIKAVGTAARIDMEKIFDSKVILKNFVTVKSNWRDNEEILKNMSKGAI